MPEGPEVRKYADALDAVLTGGVITTLEARTREARLCLARLSYETGATANPEDRKRMTADSSLVYQPGREYGTRHLVFRRTNLPCLRCGQTIRQLRQKTYDPDHIEGDSERTRIVYFCAKCQKVKKPV